MGRGEETAFGFTVHHNTPWYIILNLLYSEALFPKKVVFSLFKVFILYNISDPQPCDLFTVHLEKYMRYTFMKLIFLGE
jgi:hypothetical protein